MRAANVILWRHGQTNYNRDGRVQGQIDIPLNETGISQAFDAARVLAKINPTAIITSDLSRAADTADALAKLINVDVQFDIRLRERSFGLWEGMNREEILGGWPEEYAIWRAGGHPDGVDVEGRVELGARFGDAVREWSGKYEISDTVVYVAHGAAIAAGITDLIGQDPEEWRAISGLNNCHWSTLESFSSEPGWRLTGHNVGP